MKNKLTLMLFAMILSLAKSSDLSAQSARDIMVKYDKVSKEASFSSFQQTKLLTSKYTVKEGKMRATEKPRVSVLEIVSKDEGVDNRDSRSVSIVIEPVRDKGVSMLTYTYAAANKDDDNWLYLPELGKVKRLSSSEGNDESASFFGSEFSVEDMTSRKIDDYTYKLLEQEAYANRPVWVLELTPTPQRARKSMYGKVELWIDKERYIILRQDLYNRNGLLFKRLTASNIEQINEVWVARRAEMNNLLTRRVTVMELMEITYNLEVSGELLTQRALTDFAYRERSLDELRTHLK